MIRQIFKGVKVAEFAWVIAGPLTIKYLADYGAEVIHIESGTRADIMRVSPPYKDGIPGVNRAAWWTDYNSNKYGVTLNLNHPRATEVVKRLVAWADVIAESFSPGVIDRWGLNYEEVKKTRPDIIYVSASIQGQTGPHCTLPGQGPHLTSLAGFTHLTGWGDREPSIPYGAYTDFIAPRFGAAALVAALDYRRKTGKGQYIDLTQYETAIHFLAPLVLSYTVNKQEYNRVGNRSDCAAPHGAYRCRGNDRWCVISVFTDEEWKSLCKVIGKQEWTKDPRFDTLGSRIQNADELDRLIEEWTVNHTPEEVMRLMQAAGVGAGVVQTTEDLRQDPQLKHRHHYQILNHSEIGRHAYDSLSFRLSKTPGALRMPAPCLGQHNEYVYTKILGMSDKEFVELMTQGVFD
jgi:crotonobetainyl-CoA:carnitine CoA-transferase CaiB-like acyl-CoA transferase